MMNFLRTLGTTSLASGLVLVGSAFGQVVEERPVVNDDKTAILTDDDRSQTVSEVDVVRRVSEILSGEARGPGEEGRIAAISDLIMDNQGRIHYVLLSRGGVAGLGGETIAVPFGISQLSYVEDGGWRLPMTMTGEQLEQAPTLEEGSLDALRDENWLQTNRQFFGAEEEVDASGTGDDSFMFRASALKDAQVRGNVDDESIANVDDVLLDDELRASYAVLGYGGVAGLGKNQVPVPFEMLRLTSGREDDRTVLMVGLDMTKERLQSETAPRLDGEYNRMLEPTFIDRVNEYFGDHDNAAAPISTGTAPAQPQP